MGCACKEKHKIDELKRKARLERKKQGKHEMIDYWYSFEEMGLDILDKILKALLVFIVSPFVILFIIISIVFKGKVIFKVPKKYYKSVVENVSKEL